VIDLCAAHGTYFDHFELAAVVSRVDERMWAAYHAAHQHAARAAWQAQYATGDAGLDELVSGFGDVLRRL
jgi:catechol-2,3-dioxygenase